MCSGVHDPVVLSEHVVLQLVVGVIVHRSIGCSPTSQTAPDRHEEALPVTIPGFGELRLHSFAAANETAVRGRPSFARRGVWCQHILSCWVQFLGFSHVLTPSRTAAPSLRQASASKPRRQPSATVLACRPVRWLLRMKSSPAANPYLPPTHPTQIMGPSKPTLTGPKPRGNLPSKAFCANHRWYGRASTDER